MKYINEIQSAITSGTADPERLEALYQTACQANEEAEFRSDLLSLAAQSSDNMLLAAWNSRFQHNPLAKAGRRIRWEVAVVLGVITGLVLWSISDINLQIRGYLPYYGLFWAPIATLFTLVFIAFVSRKNILRTILAGVLVAVPPLYVILITGTQSNWSSRSYLDMMAIHLVLLCWIGLGITLMGLRSEAIRRFSFLIKSLEVAIAAGLYLIFGAIFGIISIGMISALGATLPDVIIRLVACGGFGLLPILAVATMYDPQVPPEDQDFSQGLSKFIATMMRLLLPLTLIILVIYILIIPFFFLAPFKERDVLIIFNLMLFGVMGMLIGATPLSAENLSLKLQKALRNGIIAVAILAGLVSLYALSAMIYRTAVGGITMNRLMTLGWNTINISVLVVIVVTQLRKGFEGWAARLHKVFSKAAIAYVVWDLFLIIAIPLLFR